MPTLAGHPRIRIMMALLWAGLLVFAAVSTLAPSFLVLHSMQHHAVSADHSTAVPSPLADLSLQDSAASRTMRIGTRSSRHPGASADLAVATAADIKPQPGATAQIAGLDHLHGLPTDLVKQLGPVDVVYMWVNGSDPVLTEELQDFEEEQHTQEHKRAGSRHPGPRGYARDSPVRHSRFDSDRDELRYSLRSLEMYMPWVNHVWIVTNGQVPTWLNFNLPNMTVVPHSSIFKDPAHLPTFSSRAIQANIANIPGLSDTFIVMEDDFMLTAPWSLADYIGQDGGQVLTGSTPVSEIIPKHNLHLQSTVHTDELFDKHFGPHPRNEPAHAPRLMQKKYLQELQQKMPDVFEQTSASPVRAPTDLMVPSAYMWYVSQFQPGKHPTAPNARTTLHDLNEAVARPYLDAAVADFEAKLAAKDPKAIAYAQHVRRKGQVQVAVEYALSSEPGPRENEVGNKHVQQLVETWSKPGAKMVCLNDDVPESAAAARPMINEAVRSFLKGHYKRASAFELESGDINGCHRRLPKLSFGKLPTPVDYKLVCNSALREGLGIAGALEEAVPTI